MLPKSAFISCISETLTFGCSNEGLPKQHWEQRTVMSVWCSRGFRNVKAEEASSELLFGEKHHMQLASLYFCLSGCPLVFSGICEVCWEWKLPVLLDVSLKWCICLLRNRGYIFLFAYKHYLLSVLVLVCCLTESHFYAIFSPLNSLTRKNFVLKRTELTTYTVYHFSQAGSSQSIWILALLRRIGNFLPISLLSAKYHHADDSDKLSVLVFDCLSRRCSLLLGLYVLITWGRTLDGWSEKTCTSTVQDFLAELFSSTSWLLCSCSIHGGF